MKYSIKIENSTFSHLPNYTTEFGFPMLAMDTFTPGRRRSSVANMAFNDSPFIVSHKNDQGQLVNHPCYSSWKCMLARCATNSNLSVYGKWLSFNNFYMWWKTQYQLDYIIDKDLLIDDNTHYSPTTCLMIPKSLNTQIVRINRSKLHPELPLGVQYSNRIAYKYSASSRGIMLYRGDDIDAAATEVRLYKGDYIKHLSTEYPVDSLISSALINKSNRILNENGVI